MTVTVRIFIPFPTLSDFGRIVKLARTFFAEEISFKRVVKGVVVGYLFVIGFFAVAAVVFMLPDLFTHLL